MSHVHYKFQSSSEHDTITFDGLAISLFDLKEAILAKSKLGVSSDFKLQITNAQTNDVYKDDKDMVPKNTSVTVTRVPIAKVYKGSDNGENMDEDSHIAFLNKKAQESVSLSEEANIRAMISESTESYNETNYTVRPRFLPHGVPPSTYVCNRCGRGGHYIQACPSAPYQPAYLNRPRVRLPTGIPYSSLIPADSTTPGAFMTANGWMISAQAYEAYQQGLAKKGSKGQEVAKAEVVIPANFLCPICEEMMTDAVKTPCCGTNYCDKCIRETLTDDEDHICPKCDEIDVSPDQLLPDVVLRQAIISFNSKTSVGVVRKKPVSGVASPAPPVSSPARLAVSESASQVAVVPPTNVQDAVSRTDTAVNVKTLTGSKPQPAPASPKSTGQSAEQSASSATDTVLVASVVPPEKHNGTTESAGTTTPTTTGAVAVSSADSVEKPPGIGSDTDVPSTASQPAASSGAATANKSMAPTVAVSGATAVQYVYRPTVPIPTAYVAPAQYPPGMRPGFPTYSHPVVYPQPAPYSMMISGAKPLLSKEDFYKMKAEMLEKSLKEKERAKKGDATDDFLRSLESKRRRSPSRSPRRSKSRTPSKKRRSYSPARRPRSPRGRQRYSPRRSRSRSPGHYARYGSPRRGSPYRGSPGRRYDRDDRYRPKESDSRYVDTYFRDPYGDRISPRDYYTQRRGTPDRREHSPHRRYEDDRYRDDYQRKKEEEYYLMLARESARSRYEDGHSRDNERGRDYKDRDYDSAEYHERRQDRSQEKYTSKDKSKYSKLDRGDSLERSVKSKEGKKSSESGGSKSRREEAEPLEAAPEEKKSRKTKKDKSSKSSDKTEKEKNEKSNHSHDDEKSNKSEQNKEPSGKSSKSKSRHLAEKSEPLEQIGQSDKVKRKTKKKVSSKTKMDDSTQSDGEGQETKSSKKKSRQCKSSEKLSKKRKRPASAERTDTKESTTEGMSPEKKPREELREEPVADTQSEPGAETPPHQQVRTISPGALSWADNKKTEKNTAPEEGEEPGEVASSAASGAELSNANSPKEITDLTSDNDKPDDDCVVIAAPGPSKWDLDDSESDTKLAARCSPTRKPTTQKTLSRKVLESAENIFRNKQVRPMSHVETVGVAGQRQRKVFLAESSDTATSRKDDSDDSDGKSDLRKKLLKIKRQKSGSTSEPDHSKFSGRHSDASCQRDSVTSHCSGATGSKKIDFLNNPKPKLPERLSSEEFEPDYGVEDEDTRSASHSATQTSGSDSSDDEEIRHKKRRKSKKEKSKHKKHKDGRKRKHKKHKKSSK